MEKSIKQKKLKTEVIKEPSLEFLAEKPKEIISEEKKETTVTKKSLIQTKAFKAAAIIAAVFVVGGLSCVSYYFYSQYKKVSENPKAVSQDETPTLIETIGKFVDLPQDEVPKIATVTDKEKLKEQVFFAKTENGDKVLFYLQNKKAILFRPSNNKIIEIMPFNLGDDKSVSQEPSQNQEVAGANITPEQSIAPEVPKIPAKVAVYNGSKIRGLAAKIGDQLAALSEVEVITKENAKGNYEKTMVIDLIGNNSEISQKIAETLGGEIGSFPETEKKPEADILVIGGNK